MPQTTTQVSQYGVTWEFDGEYTVGKHPNVDPWVYGPTIHLTRADEQRAVPMEVN